MPAWITEVQAFGPALIGVGAITLSVQQFRVSARKLKLDLYQRRYDVFLALHAYMTTSSNSDLNIKNTDNDSNKNERKASAQTMLSTARTKAYEKMAESRFLFDDATCTYIRKYVEKISIFLTTKDLFRSGEMDGAPEEKVNLSERNMERTIWMTNQYEPLVSAFIPSMKLDHAFGLPRMSWIISGLKLKIRR